MTRTLENEDLVRAIVLRFVPNSSEFFDDAMQEGRIALFEAGKSWTPSGCASLRTYATPRIRWRVLKEMRKQRRGGFWNRGKLGVGGVVPRPGLVSFDTATSNDDEGLHELVASKQQSPEAIAIEKESVESAYGQLLRLPPRSARVLVARFCEDKTLAEVGLELGINRERVRQIEEEALSIVRRGMGIKTAA